MAAVCVAVTGVGASGGFAVASALLHLCANKSVATLVFSPLCRRQCVWLIGARIKHMVLDFWVVTILSYTLGSARVSKVQLSLWLSNLPSLCMLHSDISMPNDFKPSHNTRHTKHM